jgi:predicted PurR-regulated permease PerM
MTQDTSSKTIKLLTLAFLIIIGLIIFKTLYFMIGAILGAITLTVVLSKPFNNLVHRKKWKPVVANLTLMFASVILILFPFYLLSIFVFSKIKPIIDNPQPMLDNIKIINNYLLNQFDINLMSKDSYQMIADLIKNTVPQIINSGFNSMTNFVFMMVILWFTLINNRIINRWLKHHLPFRLNQNILLVRSVKMSIYSNAIGLYILAFIQAIVAIIGYYIFGVNEPITWGLITGIVSVIPVVGTMAVWLPLSIYSIAQGTVMPGLMLGLYGFFIIGSSDNVFRFILQKKIAETHPLITIFGVLFGISLLGFWGVIYGPVLMVLFIALFNQLHQKQLN